MRKFPEIPEMLDKHYKEFENFWKMPEKIGSLLVIVRQIPDFQEKFGSLLVIVRQIPDFPENFGSLLVIVRKIPNFLARDQPTTLGPSPPPS